MNEHKRALIQELAADMVAKRQHFEMLGIMNQQTDPVKRKQQAISYALARAEYFEANALLETAIKG